MKSKVKTLAEALEKINDGQRIMIGGFMAGSTP
jgi:acyl CoA:acetate/3-ketoacid CoA transferase alpha subunit